VAFNYSQDTWVNFKLFGITGIMFVFIIGQTLLLSKYLGQEDQE
jgi:intracellular septation protein